MKPVLIAESIGKSYQDKRVLVSARVVLMPGKLTFVAGRNGSGKSSLLRICAGVTQPDHGTVEFAGQKVVRPSLARFARSGLFFLPDRELLAPNMRLDVQFGALAKRFRLTGFEQVADSFGIGDKLDSAPTSLSGGELRRAEVCLGVFRAPACLIADEPLRGIDPKDSELILQQLLKLAEAGCAVAISGHNSRLLLDFAHSVIWVTSGTTYHFESSEEAMRSEQFRRDYLTGHWN